MWTCTGGQNQVWNIVNGSTPPPPTSTTSRTSSTSTTSSITSTTTTSTTTSTTSSSSRSTTTTSTSATPTWSSKGCYVDAAWPNRALTGSNATLTNDTPALCQSTCASQGFQYAGVEHGNQCFCGNSLQVNTGGAGEGVSVDSTDCQMACAGDANQFCGGTSWRIFIYQLTTGGPTSTSSVSSTTTTTSAGSGSTLPALWSSKGCYVDAAAPNRALGSYSVDSDSNTPTQCINTCFGQGFIFAGVEFSDECYCANSIHASGGAGVLAAASDCNMPCAGDSSQNCGAGWRLQIYSYSGTPPSTSTATATISVSTPTSAVKISQNHFSFSIELDRWPDWTGTSSQNTFYFNVLNNLKGITGQPPKIRVGGNSEDNAQYSTSVQVGLFIISLEDG
jgi:glucan endo-1,3-alpha-glucosidase